MFHCLCCLISMDGQRTLWAMRMMGTTFSRLILGVKEQRCYNMVEKKAPTCEQLCLSLAWPKNEVLCPSTEIKMNIFCEAKIHLDRKTMFHCRCCLISMGGQAMPWAMKVTGITFTRFSLPLKKITIKMRKYVKGRRRGHGRGISSGHSKRSWFGQWQR